MLYGYFAPGIHLRYYEEEIAGFHLIRAELPQTKHPGAQLQKAMRFLRRAGVRVTLNGSSDLERYGMVLVETGSMYRKNAALVARMSMEHQGLLPHQTVVGLRSSRWTKEISSACEKLVGQVKSLSLALPEWEMEAASWTLQKNFGISVPSGDGDLTLCFTPCEAKAGRLLLEKKRPNVEGVRFGSDFSELPMDAAEGLAALLCPY